METTGAQIFGIALLVQINKATRFGVAFASANSVEDSYLRRTHLEA